MFTPSVQQTEQQQQKDLQQQLQQQQDVKGPNLNDTIAGAAQQLSQNQLQATNQMPSHVSLTLPTILHKVLYKFRTECCKILLHLCKLSIQSPVHMVSTLNQAQTQYLNQLTQQTSSSSTAVDKLHHQQQQQQQQQYGATVQQSYNNATQQYGVGGTGYNAPQQYVTQPTNAYVNNTYGTSYGTDQNSAQQPVRTKQRARVPPPSKVIYDVNPKKSLFFLVNHQSFLNR